MPEQPDPQVSTTAGDATWSLTPETVTVEPEAAPVARYDLGEQLAEGGMGAVLRATDRVLRRPVAVKVVKPALLARADLLRRFAEEARITAGLQHPGVPPIYDLGTLPDGRPFLAMKLIVGDTFAAQLRKRPSPAEELARHLLTFEGICQTVAYAHEQGVIHRDLKPLNVMVGAFGEVQVMDWGLAKDSSHHTECADRSSLPARPDETRAGSIMGTPAYMPPEQARGEPVDARADVFALGSILCEILTGEPAYAAGGTQALFQAQRADLADAEARLTACGADPELLALARRCLSPERDARPVDAAAVAAAVAAQRTGVEARLRATGRDRAAAEARAVEARKRGRVLAFAWGVGGLLLAVVVGAWAWINSLAAEARFEQQRQETATFQVAGGALTEAANALRNQYLDRAAGRLTEARNRLGEVGFDDLRELLTRLDRDLRMSRRLDELFRQRWTFVEGHSPREEVRAAYPVAFAEYGLRVGTDPTATLLATLAATPIAARLRTGLEDWLTLAEEPALRGALAALLNADNPDSPVARTRSAYAAGDRQLLRRLAAETPADDLTPRQAQLLAERGGTDADRVRLLRAVRANYPADLAVAFQLVQTLTPDAPTPATLLEGEGILRGILCKQDDNATAWLNLGTVLRARGEFAAAVAAQRRAVRHDPGNAKAHLGLGNALRAKGEPAAAAAAYRESLRLDKEYAAAYDGLGGALFEAKDAPGAVAALREAVRLEKDNAGAWFNLGNVLHQTKELPDAVQALRASLALRPDNAKAQYTLALALNELRDGPGTLAAARAAVRLAPDDGPAQFLLGVTLRKLRDHAGAATALRAAARLEPTRALYQRVLGDALRAANDTEGAITAYRAATRLEPDHAPTHYNLGLLLHDADDLPGAVAAYRAAARFDPKDAQTQCNLGHALRDAGEFAAAVVAFERGHELGRQQPGWKYPSERWLATARDLVHQDATLPRVLEGAEDLSPLATARFAGFCGVRVARFTEAVALYERAFRVDPLLVLDLGDRHRYLAARAAVRAAQGDGVHPPAEMARPALRKQALAWLQADLAARKKDAPASLAAWLDDDQFASVRDDLGKLPTAERAAWARLWAEVRRVAGR